jgi:hypothetical protein
MAPPLPNFVVIGAQRSATRWLRTNLIDHPQVFAPPFDVSFFNNGHRYRQGGDAWYREQFAAWEGERCVGESSPGYLLWRSNPRVVAERMKSIVPDARLVALVRQPVDRMYSALLQEVRNGRLSPDVDLFTMVMEEHTDVEKLDLVNGGRYAESLYPYHHLFGDQLLVVPHEQIRDEPAKAYDAVLRHIGADPDFEPPHLHSVLFSNRGKVRLTGPRPTPDQLRILYSLFRDDVEELEAMFLLDLHRWDPGPPPHVP